MSSQDTGSSSESECEFDPLIEVVDLVSSDDEGSPKKPKMEPAPAHENENAKTNKTASAPAPGSAIDEIENLYRSIPLSDLNWENLHVSDLYVQRCKNRLGLERPTHVQAACIPQIYQGKHCLVTSPTGTGKTLAFAIPMMGKWSIDPFGVFGLVLTPTRELAYQIRDQFCLLATNVSVCTIVGGVDMQTQGLEMQRRPSFIVATPGRLADHMETNREMCQSIFRQTRYLVIDEADRILDGQFDKQLAPIREHLPSGVQILLFSATMTENLKEITGVLMGNNKPFIYDPTGLVEEKTLLQRVVPCPVDFKDGYLIEILRSVRDGEFAISKTIGSTIIFATTNRECEVLQILLDELGFMNVTLHSLMPQRARAHALAQFKSSCVPILIATDIASRGLDILAVDLVINYSVPMPVDYVHRIGRAGRGCRKGIAITFVTPRDCKFIQNVVSYTQTDLTEYIVDESKVLKVLQEVMAAKKAAELNVEEYDVFRERRENYKRKREMLEESSSDSDDSSISSTDDYDSPPADAELRSRKVSAKPKQQQTKSP